MRQSVAAEECNYMTSVNVISNNKPKIASFQTWYAGEWEFIRIHSFSSQNFWIIWMFTDNRVHEVEKLTLSIIHFAYCFGFEFATFQLKALRWCQPCKINEACTVVS